MPKKEALGRSEDQQYQEGESRKSKRKEKAPRFVKNTVENVDPNEIVVNLSKTQYDIIQIVVQELGWVVQTSKKSQKWDIMWTDYHIEAQDLFKLNDYQKISHFPAIYVLAKKNFLGKSLMKMNKLYPKEYDFFPSTWSVPSELGELMRFDQQAQQHRRIYIFKPEASSQGKGIALFQNLQEIEGKTGIVQTYIDNPYLVDGLKFDMRIYVLIYGCDPMRIYIYEQGLARFATESYERPKKKNLKDTYVHLTNYAINKVNKKFVFNTSQKNMNVGHKRSLTSIYHLLKARNVDIQTVKNKIDSLIVKTLLVGKPMLMHMYGLSQMDNLSNDHCFHILGFDVLLDDHTEPILLEVNHTPSFTTDTPLDKTIKKQLIKETLLLLNVNVETKKAKLEKMKEFEEKRMMRKLTKLAPEEKTEIKNYIEREKDQHQAITLKKFRKLYPFKQNDYLGIQTSAQKIFNLHMGLKVNQGKQSKETKMTKSPSAKRKYKVIRPQSFQQIHKETKIENSNKLRGLSVNNDYSALVNYDERLPDIAQKVGSLKETHLSPKKLMKTYQFSPEKVFSQLEEKAKTYKPYFRSRYDEMSLSQRLKNSEIPPNMQGKGQQIFEPRLLKLKQIAVQNLNLFEQYILKGCVKKQKKANQQQKPKIKNFAAFVMANKDRAQFDYLMIDQTSLIQRGMREKQLSGGIMNKGFLGEEKKVEYLNQKQYKQMITKYKYRSKQL